MATLESEAARMPARAATLDALLAETWRGIEERRQLRPLAELEELVTGRHSPQPFAEALARPGTSVIAEFKRSSPSAGVINARAAVPEMVRKYERAGAAALSVLTHRRFDGSLADLETARSHTALPILRKDFTLDPYQLYEARVAGADAVLLVVSALEPRELGTLYGLARDLELDSLVEVRTERELAVALEYDVDVIGINNRDFSNYVVKVEVTHELLSKVPAGKVVVSESGIRSRETIESLEEVGVDAVLIGQCLMEAADPEATLRDLTRAEEPTGT
jgi:indole-3-glycerol phosphate synthase